MAIHRNIKPKPLIVLDGKPVLYNSWVRWADSIRNGVKDGYKVYRPGNQWATIELRDGSSITTGAWKRSTRPSGRVMYHATTARLAE